MTTMSVNKTVSETNPVLYREVEHGTEACRKWLSGKGRTDEKLGWHPSYPSEKALLDHIFTNIRHKLINLHQGMAPNRNMKDREVRRAIGEVLSRELLLNGVTRIGKLLLIHSTSMSLTLRTAPIPQPILQPFPGFTQSPGMLGPAGPGPQSQDRQHRLAYAQAMYIPQPRLSFVEQPGSAIPTQQEQPTTIGSVHDWNLMPQPGNMSGLSQSASPYIHNASFPQSMVQNAVWGQPSQTSPYNARHPVGTIQASGDMIQPGAGLAPAQRALDLDPYHTVHNPASSSNTFGKSLQASPFNFNPVINAAAVCSGTPKIGRASAPFETPKSPSSVTPSSLPMRYEALKKRYQLDTRADMSAGRLLPFPNPTNELHDSNPSAPSSRNKSKVLTGPSHPGAGPRQSPHKTLAKKRKMSYATNQSEKKAQKIARLIDELKQTCEASDDEDDGSLPSEAESRKNDVMTKAVLATGNSGPQVCYLLTGSSTTFLTTTKAHRDRSVRSTDLSTAAVSHPDKAPVLPDTHAIGTYSPPGWAFGTATNQMYDGMPTGSRQMVANPKSADNMPPTTAEHGLSFTSTPEDCSSEIEPIEESPQHPIYPCVRPFFAPQKTVTNTTSSWGVFFSENRVLSLYRNDAFFVLTDVLAALGCTGGRNLNQAMIKFAHQTGSCPVGTNTIPSNRTAIKLESLIAIVLKAWEFNGVPADENNVRERKMIAVYVDLLIKGVKSPQITCFKCNKVMHEFEVDGCARGRHHFATQTCGKEANMDVGTCICGLMFCEAKSWDEHVVACKMRVRYEAASSRNVINVI
jgi:hypothetical protein